MDVLPPYAELLGVVVTDGRTVVEIHASEGHNMRIHEKNRPPVKQGLVLSRGR